MTFTLTSVDWPLSQTHPHVSTTEGRRGISASWDENAAPDGPSTTNHSVCLSPTVPRYLTVMTAFLFLRPQALETFFVTLGISLSPYRNPWLISMVSPSRCTQSGTSLYLCTLLFLDQATIISHLDHCRHFYPVSLGLLGSFPHRCLS